MVWAWVEDSGYCFLSFIKRDEEPASGLWRFFQNKTGCLLCGSQTRDNLPGGSIVERVMIERDHFLGWYENYFLSRYFWV